MRTNPQEAKKKLARAKTKLRHSTPVFQPAESKSGKKKINRVPVSVLINKIGSAGGYGHWWQNPFWWY